MSVKIIIMVQVADLPLGGVRNARVLSPGYLAFPAAPAQNEDDFCPSSRHESCVALAPVEARAVSFVTATQGENIKEKIQACVTHARTLAAEPRVLHSTYLVPDGHKIKNIFFSHPASKAEPDKLIQLF